MVVPQKAAIIIFQVIKKEIKRAFVRESKYGDIENLKAEMSEKLVWF